LPHFEVSAEASEEAKGGLRSDGRGNGLEGIYGRLERLGEQSADEWGGAQEIGGERGIRRRLRESRGGRENRDRYQDDFDEQDAAQQPKAGAPDTGPSMSIAAALRRKAEATAPTRAIPRKIEPKATRLRVVWFSITNDKLSESSS
jgi:hypothetical protein